MRGIIVVTPNKLKVYTLASNEEVCKLDSFEILSSSNQIAQNQRMYVNCTIGSNTSHLHLEATEEPCMMILLRNKDKLSDKQLNDIETLLQGVSDIINDK